ncbi:MAG: hypothetical protein IH988_10500 [Planctomycetes bacterium]|nr:hypothetical protein [Planctomycetota bacterium]
MRVGLVQFPRTPGERTTNLMRTLAAIDRAAAAEPGPDLLILPGQCDGGGVLNTDGDEISHSSRADSIPGGNVRTDGHATAGASTGQDQSGDVSLADENPTVIPAMAEAFSESIAARAREWGVYIAAGACRNRQGVVAEGAALFDPDGDVLLECWDHPATSLVGPAVSCGETPIGRLTLQFGQTPDHCFDPDPQAADPVLAVVWLDGPGPKHRRGPSAEEAEEQCRALAARWCVAVCAVFPPPIGPCGSRPVAGLTVCCRPGDRPAHLAGRGSNEVSMVELT